MENNDTSKLSYDEARENFKNRIDNIPSDDSILPNFISNHMSDFIMAWKPNQESEISQRERDKRCASILLKKAISNKQLINENQKKEYSEDTENRLLLNFKEKKITLPDHITNQRDNDIKILQSLSSNYEAKKDAFMRFENQIKIHLPKIYIKILHTYANAVTDRLSMQKILAELQKWNTSWSLLWEEVINKIQ